MGGGNFPMVWMRQIAALFLALLLLFVWRETYALHCAALIIPLVVISLISWSAREYAVLRRRCLVRCYFRKKGILARLFSGVLFTTLIAFLSSLFTGGVLMLNVLTWDQQILVILTLDSLFVLLLLKVLFVLFGSAFRADMGSVLVRNWVVALNTLIVMAVVLYIQFYHVPHPGYIDRSSWEKTIEIASQTNGSNCSWTDWLTRMQIEKEATSWWWIIWAQDNLDNQFLRLMLWITFLISGSLSIWGYSRYLVQAINLSLYHGGEDE